MKRLVLVLGLVALTATAAGAAGTVVQDDYWNFSVKPEFKLTQLGGDTAGLAGIQMGPSIRNNFYLGLGWYGLINDVQFDDSKGKGELGVLDFWYAGFVADYTFLPTEVVHGSIGALLGGGRVQADQSAGGSSRADVVVFEPGVNLLVNVAPNVEFGVGVAYRMVNGSDIDGLGDSDLSGVAGSVFFRWTE